MAAMEFKCFPFVLVEREDQESKWEIGGTDEEGRKEKLNSDPKGLKIDSSSQFSQTPQGLISLQRTIVL